MAVPEPAPIPRNFIVFFDWDSSELTNEARGVIASAAAYAAQGGVSNIKIIEIIHPSFVAGFFPS